MDTIDGHSQPESTLSLDRLRPVAISGLIVWVLDLTYAILIYSPQDFLTLWKDADPMSPS